MSYWYVVGVFQLVATTFAPALSATGIISTDEAFSRFGISAVIRRATPATMALYLAVAVFLVPVFWPFH
jgi:hypothetical protein